MKTQAHHHFYRTACARATALFLMGGSADVIEAVLAGRLRFSRTALVDHLTSMWLGALGIVASADRPGVA